MKLSTSLNIFIIAVSAVSIANASERPSHANYDKYVNECTSYFNSNGESCWNAGMILKEKAQSGIKTEAEKQELMSKARVYFKRGCDLKNGRACNSMASTYVISGGEYSDKDLFINYLYKGKECKDLNAIAKLAILSYQKDKKEEDVKTLEALCSKGGRTACGYLAAIAYDEHVEREYDRDSFNKMREAFKVACLASDVDACLLLYSDTSLTEAENKKYLDIAVEQCYKDVNCQSKTLTRIVEKLAKEQQYTSASKLANFGCDHLYAYSCYLFGEMAKKGVGTRKDLTLAKEYFGKACDLGNNEGCKGYASLVD